MAKTDSLFTGSIDMFKGGRRAAVARLHQIEPALYGKTRNHLDGDVTRLSPYIRHGVLSLAEIRDHALNTYKPSSIAKFLNELAWRDYYQRVWRTAGDAIWKDIEPYKTGHSSSSYADELPQVLISAKTGVDYLDHFVNELHETGYLHNHARMWMAAYVVHALKCKWQAGARWFLSHLLDGDEASNNLSWQWVASTFSHKPYIFNRENVLKYSGDRFSAHSGGKDPFDSDYDSIARKLFDVPVMDDYAEYPRVEWKVDAGVELDDKPAPKDAVTFVHDGMLAPTHPALRSDIPRLFVWDKRYLKQLDFSAKRVKFIEECVAEIDFVEVEHADDVAACVEQFAKKHNASTVLTGDTPDPRLKRYFKQLGKQFDVRLLDHPPLVELKGQVDVKRFSRYWSKAERVLVG
jgi:deoxyribodipyrimidine photo-lyase